MKALALKELREVVGIAAVALGLYLAMVFSSMGIKLFTWFPFLPQGTRGLPFNSEFMSFFGFVSVVFALALGFRQSAWEASRGTYLFLLHRPLARNAIFLTKLAVGGGLLLLCAAAPILLYGWWAATPGHHASPFFWSMTVPAWRFALLTLLLYFGAFLSGLRPARWFGTRLLPLFAAVGLVMLLIELPWTRLAFSVGIVFGGMTISTICFVARERDYA